MLKKVRNLLHWNISFHKEKPKLPSSQWRNPISGYNRKHQVISSTLSHPAYRTYSDYSKNPNLQAVGSTTNLEKRVSNGAKVKDKS